jgi:MFS family permease
MLMCSCSVLCYAVLDYLSVLLYNIQSAVVETTPEGSARVAALGRLTVCYTIGSIIGPGVGGIIGATGNYYLGAQASVIGSLFSVFLCFFMQAPARNHNASKKEDIKTEDSFLLDETNSSIAKKSFPYNVFAVIQAVWLLLGTKLVSGKVPYSFFTLLSP